MRVLFLMTETLRKNKAEDRCPLYTQEDIPLGVSYIASMLENYGHKVEACVETDIKQFSTLKRIIEEFQPNVIGISMVFRECFSSVKAATYIKENYPCIYLFAGGPHVTLNPQKVLEEGFDSVCLGEGEYPVLELVNMLEQGVRPSGIRNFWFKNNSSIEVNETREFIQDLDHLPFPNRRIWQKFVKNKEGLHDILVGRGCPFQCTYCCNHKLRKVSEGKYVRFRSPENVIEEIRSLRKEFSNIDTIFFETEAINLDINFLTSFTDELAEFNKTLEKPIAYGANIRLHQNMDIPKVIHQFVKANIVIINVGLESGSERVRKEILSRPEYTNEDVKLIVKLAKKYHRHIMLFVLLGLPGETLEEERETVELVRECRPSFVHLGIFNPYPGTNLYDICVKEKLVEPGNYHERGRHVAAFNTQYMTKKEIQKEYFNFFPRVYANNGWEYARMKIIFYLIYRWDLTFLATFGKKYLK